MRRTVLTLALVAWSAAAATAQVTKMERGPELDRLDPLVGQWRSQGKAYFRGEAHDVSNRTVTRWLPGGVWLEIEMEMPSSPIGPMFGKWHVAWDRNAGEYVRYYVDNQSVNLLASRGRWLDEKTLEFRGSFDWFGTTYHLKETLILEGPDRYPMRGYMGTDPEKMELNHDEIVTREEPVSPGDGRR